jgi:hypothetical protein
MSSPDRRRLIRRSESIRDQLPDERDGIGALIASESLTSPLVAGIVAVAVDVSEGSSNPTIAEISRLSRWPETGANSTRQAVERVDLIGGTRSAPSFSFVPELPATWRVAKVARLRSGS